MTAPGTYPSATPLDLKVNNPSTNNLQLTLTLRGRGLDSRDATLVLGTLTLNAGTSSDINPPISLIPLQSVGTQSALTIEMGWVDGSGYSHTIVSQPLFFTFTSAQYDHATVYDRFGQPIIPGTPEQYFGTNRQGLADVTDAKLGTLYASLATTNTTLTGRYWNGSGWTTYSRPQGSFIGSSFVGSGNIAKIMENQALGLHQPGLIGGTTCINWRVDWGDDAAANPPEANHAGPGGLYPARYARVAIFPAATPTMPIFSDYLDGNGCTKLPSNIPNGGYTMLLFGRAQNGTTTTIARDHLCNGAHILEQDLDCNCKCTTNMPYTWSLDGNPVSDTAFPQVYGISFYVSGLMPGGPFTPGFSSLIQDVAATQGQYLAGWNTGTLANKTYLAYANQVCPGIDTTSGPTLPTACFPPGSGNGRCQEACANTSVDNAAYFGFNYTDKTNANLDLGSSNSRVKFTVAHEIGHTVEESELGGLPAEVFDLGGGEPLLCRCDGLNPVGNTLHCLQSSNTQATAQVEGFAQFSSANVWNDHTSSDCNFSYYKSFRNNNEFQTIITPPVAIKCNWAPVSAPKWTETNCPITGRASEYDWMEFYVAVSRDSTAAILQSDLMSVYSRECSDEGKPGCNGATVQWTSTGANLPTAAAEVFGFNTPRYQTFANDGASYGVTR